MILFICHGNVARSLFAEAILREAGYENAVSAGTNVSPEREGNLLSKDGPAAIRSVEYFLKITGIDISMKKRKSISEEMVRLASKIIVLNDRKYLPEYVLDCKVKVEYWDIEDPHDMDIDGYRTVIERIKNRVDRLVNS